MGCQISDEATFGLVFALLLLPALLLVGLSLRHRKARRLASRSVVAPPQLARLHAQYGGTLDPGSLRFTHGASKVLIESTDKATRLVIDSGLAHLGFGFENIGLDPDLGLGDEDFDPVVHLQGDLTAAVALLTPGTRRLMRGAVLAGFRMDLEPKPTLTMEVSGHAEYIAPHIATGLALATALAAPVDMTGLLMSRLRDEPLSRVQQSLVGQLPTSLGADPQRLAELCAHPDPATRLLLAHRFDHPALWATLPEPTLIAALSSPTFEPRRIAITRLSTHGTIAAVPALLELREDEVLGSFAADAILAIQSRATGSRGDLALATHDGGLSLAPHEPSR